MLGVRGISRDEKGYWFQSYEELFKKEIHKLSIKATMSWIFKTFPKCNGLSVE